MSNLIEQLTPEYCNDRVAGALVLYNGRAAMFLGADIKRGVTSVLLEAATGDANDPGEAEAVRAPARDFPSWAAFGFPQLGYRQVENGKGLAFLSRLNSVMRGLHWRDLRIDWHEVSSTLNVVYGQFNTASWSRGHRLAAMVMRPVFTPFAEGLKKVMAGEIPAFAVSPDFAVAPSEDVPYLEILYRTRRIGTIAENGDISINEAKMLPSWQDASK